MTLTQLALPVLPAITLFTLHAAVLGGAVGVQLGLWRDSDPPGLHNRWLQAFFAISLGLVVEIALLFVLGMLDVFRGGVIAAVGGTVFVGALFVARGWLGAAWQQLRRTPWLEWLPPLGVVALVFGGMVLTAFQVPGHWDDTMYHLPMARDIVRHGGIQVNEFLRFPLFPANVTLLVSLGLMTGGDVLAQAMAALPVFVMFLGLVGATVWLTDSVLLGLLATLLLLSLRPLGQVMGYAYVDNGLGLFAWAAVLGLAQALQRPRGASGWLFATGLLAGAAIGTKYFGVVIVGLLGLVHLLWRRDLRQTAWLALGIVLAGSWWYVRNVVIAGDPVHPAGGNLFGFYLWDAADLIGQKQEQATHGVPPMSFDVWGALKKAGVEWLLPAFASLLFVRRAPPPVRLMQVLFVAYFLFWFFVTQVERYLSPVFGIAAFLGAYALYAALCTLLGLLPERLRHLPARGLRHPLVVAVLALALVLPLFSNGVERARQNAAGWNDTLNQRTGFALLGAANRQIPSHGARLVQIGYENGVYYFDGVVIGDWFGPGRYRAMMDCSADGCTLIKPAAMKALLARFDSRMLAVNTERFKLDLSAYEREFDVLARTPEGVLMAPKAR